MGGTDRVEVLCAAQLEGPGLSRWSTCHMAVAAVACAGKLNVSASVKDSSNYGPRPSWSFSSKPKTPLEAVSQVKALAENPAEAFERGRVTGTPAQREELRALFTGLKTKFFVDTTQGASELAGDAITVGMGRYLVAIVEQGADLTPTLTVGIERYFSKAPFTFGYWAPYKRLIKLLEARPDAVALLAVGLARVDGQLQHVANVQANDQLHSFVPTEPPDVAGPSTVAYLMRRGRRWLRRLGRSDQSAYVRCAAALLEAADAQAAHAQIAGRWILADILYGRGASNLNHGHGRLALPTAESRYRRRWDRYPKAWNEHIEMVQRIWRVTVQNPDIQVWAFNVLKSQPQPPPLLGTAALRLALVSPAARLRNHACAQVAEKPEYLLDLDGATIQVFLENCSAKQFSAVFSTLEAHAETRSVQDAVLAYIHEHGLPELRRGALPPATEKRAAVLLRYSLRFLRPRFNAIDTYHLARYVGQTTQFRPVAQWRDTFRALPLKTLVELRLQLTDLPSAVIRSIDGACRDAVVNGAGDENLAAALTLSPAPELRALGWNLLARASDATVLTVWTNLITQSETPKGREALLDALRGKDRVEQIERHPAAAQLFSNLVVAVAMTDSKVAEGLLWRLAAKGDSRQTLDMRSPSALPAPVPHSTQSPPNSEPRGWNLMPVCLPGALTSFGKTRARPTGSRPATGPPIGLWTPKRYA